MRLNIDHLAVSERISLISTMLKYFTKLFLHSHSSRVIGQVTMDNASHNDLPGCSVYILFGEHVEVHKPFHPKLLIIIYYDCIPDWSETMTRVVSIISGVTNSGSFILVQPDAWGQCLFI